MKKLLLVTCYFLLVTFLSACGTPPPDRSGTTYTGTITYNGKTWVFETDNDIFSIKSAFLDLNPYMGKKIKIHGQFSKDLFFIDDVKLAL